MVRNLLCRDTLTEREAKERVRERTMVKMAVLGLLGSLLYLLTGVSGETLSMFSRVGDDVSLPCNNVVNPDCSSTTWLFNRDRTATERVSLGKVIKQPQLNNMADRLSVGSDCSLRVSDVRAEDAGFYICEQYLTETGLQHGEDAHVLLSILTRSTASTARPALSTPSSAGTSNTVKLPISHIMLFVTLTIMAAIVTIHTRRNRPPKALPPQAEEASGIEVHVLEE
ncbi:uncharacterized protein LOC120035382 isoform X1 [Salvelinus namaycush]|uniref:Uncharacterized protein LOC120035382 isoform X1 n=1 Tax=Salvelinus namaycush TaxID=8040 RepID=A0A8U0Q7J3_SALNM|nr:uncharacterized protein LOC120035382 isoform X1 [Salvelinus namaycush]